MSNAYKEVGTLKGIGAQVGDVVEWDELEWEVHTNSRFAKGVVHAIHKDGKWIDGMAYPCRIISRAQPSPVRTVTTTQIIPGQYGCVKVHDPGSKYVRINVDSAMDVEALTAAITTLTTIRDAMQANANEK